MKKYLHILLSAVMLICAAASDSWALSFYQYYSSDNPNLGDSYNASFSVFGGKSPYIWSCTSLPSGLRFSENGGNASISGTVERAGDYTFWVTVYDSTGDFAMSNMQYWSVSDPNSPPSVRKNSLKDGVPVTEYSDEVSAANGKSPYTWEITSGTLPPGIKFVNSDDKAVFYGKLTKEEGIYTFSLKVTDSNGRTGEEQVTMKVAYTPLSISGWIPGEGSVGSEYCSPYGARFSAEEGAAPYIWRISKGFIPPGMSLDVTGNGVNSVRIIGTPVSPDTYNFTLSVIDGKGKTAEKDLTLKVNGDKISHNLYIDGDLPDVTLAPEWRSEKYYGYYETVYIKGGRSPYESSIIAGSLPEGISMSTVNWYGENRTDWLQFQGTLIENGAYAENEFILKVVDADGRTLLQKFSISVPGGLPGGSKNVKAPYTIPVISGDFADAKEGKSFSGFVIALKGKAPYTWSVINKIIPEGLTLSFSDSKKGISSDDNTMGKYARLTGTPKFGGQYAIFTLKVTDANGNSDARQFMIKVAANSDFDGVVPINEKTFPDKTFRNYVLEKCDTNGDGLLSKKEAANVKSIYLGSGSAADLTGVEFFTALTTLDCSLNKLTKLDLRKNTKLTWLFCYGNELTMLDVSGNTALKILYCAGNKLKTLDVSKCTKLQEFDCSENLLTSLDLNKNTALTYLNCSLNKLTKLDVSKNTALRELDCSINKIKALDVGNCPNVVKVLCDENVKVSSAVISTKTLSNTIRGVSYSVQLSGKKGKTPYTWTVSDGKLPDGLKLTKSTGKITGKPTKAGIFTFTVQLKDNNGYTATKAFTVKVTQTTLNLTVPATIIRGKSYTCTPKVSGGTSSYKWTISKGKLPDGLSINASTGKITGKPTKAGTFKFTVKVTDKNNVAATKAFTVKVTQTTITALIPATIVRGKSYTWTLKATGGTSAYTWTISKGSLPTGMKINASTGKITGKPTKTGKFSFTLKAKDKNNIAATKAFTVKVTESASTTTQTVKSKTTTQFETDTSINGLKSSIPVTLQTEELTSIQGNGTINLVATLNVSSDDVVEAYEGKDSDLVKVKAGKVLTFIVGDWGVDVSLITVYVDDKAVESVKVEDSSFTLPAEIVYGDFKVCVKAVSGSIELESEEIYIISE